MKPVNIYPNHTLIISSYERFTFWRCSCFSCTNFSSYIQHVVCKAPESSPQVWSFRVQIQQLCPYLQLKVLPPLNSVVGTYPAETRSQNNLVIVSHSAKLRNTWYKLKIKIYEASVWLLALERYEAVHTSMKAYFKT